MLSSIARQNYSAFGKSLCTYKRLLEVMSKSVYTGLNPFNFIRKHFLQICVRTALRAVASPIYFSCANLCNDFVDSAVYSQECPLTPYP
jgi:hypothetical protein